jgi:hypothetical protein
MQPQHNQGSTAEQWQETPNGGLSQVPAPCTCSACGSKAAIRTVSGKNTTEPDGRRAAVIRTRTNCSACYAKVDWGMKIVETLRRDDREGIPLEVPNA